MTIPTPTPGAAHPAAPPHAELVAARAAAAHRLYCAECALHDARQSHVDAWVAAAYERLHDADVAYAAASAALAAESA